MSFPLGPEVPGWTPRPVPSSEPIDGTWCRVEPLSESRADELHRANSADEAMWTYLSYGPFTPEAYREWVREGAASTDPLFFAIVDRASGRAAGVASLLRIDPENGSIEVGHLAYSAELQRTTAATEAMFLLMRLAFDGLGYRRYEWKCNALNAASRRAAERLGFAYEGTFRQAKIDKGRSRDTAWFAIIDRDWPAIRAEFERWLSPENFTPEGRQKTPLQCKALHSTTV